MNTNPVLLAAEALWRSRGHGDWDETAALRPGTDEHVEVDDAGIVVAALAEAGLLTTQRMTQLIAQVAAEIPAVEAGIVLATFRSASTPPPSGPSHDPVHGSPQHVADGGVR